MDINVEKIAAITVIITFCTALVGGIIKYIKKRINDKKSKQKKELPPVVVEVIPKPKPKLRWGSSTE